jgi:hypothetical protein
LTLNTMNKGFLKIWLCRIIMYAEKWNHHFSQSLRVPSWFLVVPSPPVPPSVQLVTHTKLTTSPTCL